MPLRPTHLFNCLLLCCPLSIAFAQMPASDAEVFLDEEMLFLEEIPVVYSAARYEQKVTQAPSSITIISSEDIQRYGYRTLGEALRSVRGFNVITDRSYEYGGFRGLGSSNNQKILLMVNGHRINENIFRAGSITTTFALDMDLIEHIEVVPGPGSSLYGTDAFFGIINVITKQGSDFDGVEVTAAYASNETRTGRLSYGKSFDNGLDVVFSASTNESEGNDRLFFEAFNDPATNNGFSENEDDSNYDSFYSKISYENISMEAAYVSRKKTVPTAYFGTDFNTGRNTTWDRQAFVDLKHHHEFNDKNSLRTRLYFDYYAYNGDNSLGIPGPGESPFAGINKDDDVSKAGGIDLQFDNRYFADHHFVFGFEYLNVYQLDQVNFNVDPAEVLFKDQRDTESWGVYFQDEFQIHYKLALNVGVRYDYYDSFGGTTNPRIGLIYHPQVTTTLKLLYGTAFSTPTAFESYFQDGLSVKLNPDLAPETVETGELIWEQYLGAHYRTVLSLFYLQIEDIIINELDATDGLLTFVNRGKVEAKGLSLELDANWAHQAEGRFSYSYLLTQDSSTNKRPINSPRHLAKANIQIPMLDNRFYWGIEAQYVGRRGTKTGAQVADYTVINLGLTAKKWIPNLTLSAHLYNLFDQGYEDPGFEEQAHDGIEQEGRTFRAKLEYRF